MSSVNNDGVLYKKNIFTCATITDRISKIFMMTSQWSASKQYDLLTYSKIFIENGQQTITWCQYRVFHLYL
jgi:hypothetical protein